MLEAVLTPHLVWKLKNSKEVCNENPANKIQSTNLSNPTYHLIS